jgi:hypothetical protein
MWEKSVFQAVSVFQAERAVRGEKDPASRGIMGAFNFMTMSELATVTHRLVGGPSLLPWWDHLLLLLGKQPAPLTLLLIFLTQLWLWRCLLVVCQSLPSPVGI